MPRTSTYLGTKHHPFVTAGICFCLHTAGMIRPTTVLMLTGLVSDLRLAIPGPQPDGLAPTGRVKQQMVQSSLGLPALISAPWDSKSWRSGFRPPPLRSILQVQPDPGPNLVDLTSLSIVFLDDQHSYNEIKLTCTYILGHWRAYTDAKIPNPDGHAMPESRKLAKQGIHIELLICCGDFMWLGWEWEWTRLRENPVKHPR